MASPPSSNPSYGGSQHEQPEHYFLNACFLCKVPLGNGDIYMYKGNLPFCSRRCREKQIHMDEALETRLKLSSATSNLTKPRTAMASPPSSASNPPIFVRGDSEDKQWEPQLPEACYLCKTPLGHNRAIYVYQGNQRFCSEDCRKKADTR